RITARRALNDLADSGLVLRMRGRGTRVSPTATERNPEPLRATLDGLLENVGHIGRMTTVRVLHFGYTPTGVEVAEKLELPSGARVLHALRVRDLADQPMSLLNTWVPEDIGALIEGQDMSTVPLLLLLESAGVPVGSATQTISATLADATSAGALNVPAGAPLIDVRRVVRDTSGRPVEFIKILYRPEMYQFQISMQRVEGAAGNPGAATSRVPEKPLSADRTARRLIERSSARPHQAMWPIFGAG
uniref:GntR family transcriptional regulator n=1 Tax=Blastomonas sp. TaxID=1909299 RepID=UPI003593BA72